MLLRPSRTHYILKQIPNILTCIRILCCPLALYFLFEKKSEMAVGLFVLTGLTDFLDGYLARRWNCVSKIGAILDPVADKIILVSFYISLMHLGLSPAWFTGLVFSVNLLQVLGFMMANLSNIQNTVTFETLKIGKWNTFLQYVWVAILIGAELFKLPSNALPSELRLVIHCLLAVLQVTTFLRYFPRFRTHFKQDFKALRSQ